MFQGDFPQGPRSLLPNTPHRVWPIPPGVPADDMSPPNLTSMSVYYYPLSQTIPSVHLAPSLQVRSPPSIALKRSTRKPDPSLHQRPVDLARHIISHTSRVRSVGASKHLPSALDAGIPELSLGLRRKYHDFRFPQPFS